MVLKKTKIINELIDLYGVLLTVNQLNILELYYKEDLSLSEIGEELKITRSAVYDSLKRSIILLEDYEEKLKLNKKEKNKQKIILNIENLSKEELLKLIKNM